MTKPRIDPERSKLLRDNAFSEVSRFEPARVTAVRNKHGEKAARRMAVAIALDDARSKGAKV